MSIAAITLLAVAVVVAYGLILWWVLRDEGWQWLAALAAIAVGAFVLRVIYPSLPPIFFGSDDVGNVYDAQVALAYGQLIGITTHFMALPLLVLFSAVPSYWFPWLPMGVLVRGYSVVSGAASTAAAYAAVRALGGSRAAGLCAALLVAVLPWSVWYGRQPYGGELVFHELLLVAMVTRLVLRADAGWRESLAGAGVLALLLYDYQAAFILPALPAVGLLLAPTWRARGWCAVMLAGAGLLYAPQIASNVVLHDIWRALSEPGRPVFGGASGQPMISPDFQADPWGTLTYRTSLALQCFAVPRAHLGNMTAPTAVVHPIWVLPLAALGWLRCGWRSKVLLLLLFGAGLLPGVVSNTFSVSAHRMVFAIPVVSLCAALSLDWVPQRARLGLALAVSTAAAYWSLTYFFWPECGSAIGMTPCAPDAPPSFWWQWP